MPFTKAFESLKALRVAERHSNRGAVAIAEREPVLVAERKPIGRADGPVPGGDAQGRQLAELPRVRG